MYFFIKNLCTSVHFWVFGALWCPETLKWAYLGNQLSVRDEPKNTFYRRRWPTDRAIFMPPGPLIKKLPLVEKASHTLFRSDTQQNMMSRYQLPRYQPAEWKNEQSISCMSGPTKWPPVPLWDRETCGGVRMATALIVVPGSRVWICYPGPGGRSAHWKIYEIKSARKNILNFSMNPK